MKNYISINGKQTELTNEQLLQLGIQPEIDFSDYNETDWFYYETVFDNKKWLSKDAFGKSISFQIESSRLYNNESNLCDKEKITFFRKATEEEINLAYSKYPELKPKNKWEDFGNVSGYYITTHSDLNAGFKLDSDENNKNIFPTKEEAEACLALSQLLQWRDKYNEGWKPDWEDENFKNCIVFKKKKIIKDCFLSTSQVLSFKDQLIRDKFLEDFRDLILVAKPLL